MASNFKLEVLTPEAALYAGEATALVCRTIVGEITFLNGHTNFIGALTPSVARIEFEGGTDEPIVVHGGFVQVDTVPVEEGSGMTTIVRLLAPVAEKVADIDVARAEESKTKAEARLNELATEHRGDDEGADPGEIADVQAAADRANLRIEAKSSAA